MNRKAFYAEAKRQTADRYGIFTPEALRAHVTRGGAGVVDRSGAGSFAIPKDSKLRSGNLVSSGWSTTATSITASLRKLRDSSAAATWSYATPVAVGLPAAAFWWANLSRYYPGERTPLRVHLGDGEYWQGDLTAR